MIKALLRTIIFLVWCSGSWADARPLFPRFPYGLLTESYSIVTEDDLAFDAANRDMQPYDPLTALSALYWQCFPAREVKPNFKMWRDSDPMGPSNVIITLCDLQIIVRSGSEVHVYADRRAHPFEYCREFMNAWWRITKNEQAVCLNGEGGRIYNDGEYGKHKSWTWEKFKTKKGCYSYFAGTCNTRGCAEKDCGPHD